MRSRIFVAALAAVALGVVAATASAGVQRAQASKITVWLQTDAQSGWPDIVAAANAQFQKDHPGYTVDVQYQNWTDHLQKFDATLAGGSAPDVIEMGNTEMTKYMAAGAFSALNKSSFENAPQWLSGLAKSGTYGGKTFGVPYYAGSCVATYGPTSSRRRGSRSFRSPRAAHRRREDAGGEVERQSRLLPGVLRQAADWYGAIAFVYDYGGTIARTHAG